MKARLPYQLSRIPDNAAGIYRIRLCLPPRHELGISSRVFNPTLVAKLVSGRLDRYRKILNYLSVETTGADERAEHIGRQFDLTVNAKLSFQTYETIAAIFRDTTFYEACVRYEEIRSLVSPLPAIYVGLCAERSIRTRIEEHVDGSTALARRLEEAGLAWDDLEVDWVISNSPYKYLRRLEIISQALSHPVLSKA